MKKIYNSSWTVTKVVIILSFWIVILISLKINFDPSRISINDAVRNYFIGCSVFSVLIIFLFKFSYIKIKDNKVLISNVLFERGTLDVDQISILEEGVSLGFIPVINVTCGESGNKKGTVQIYASQYKKETLREFIFDLKKLNSAIKLEPSLEKFIGKF